MMNKICVITGANGYVGGQISSFMNNNGWKIIKLQREINSGDGSLKYVLGELNESKLPNKVDLVIHCAHDFNNEESNINGAIDLYTKIKDRGRPKILFISSISVINGCNSKYAILKLKIEKITRDYGGTSIRLGLVYGPNAGGMFGKISKFIKGNFLIPIIGDGSEKIYTTYINDLCKFINLLTDISNLRSDLVYSAFSKEPISFNELILNLISFHGKKYFIIIKIPYKLLFILFKISLKLKINLSFNEDNLKGINNSNFPNGFGEFIHELDFFRKFDFSHLKI
jgi:nucleoside-diphosphate-sugar epimerase